MQTGTEPTLLRTGPTLSRTGPTSSRSGPALSRRGLLGAAVLAGPLALALPGAQADAADAVNAAGAAGAADGARRRLRRLEADYPGRIGVAVLDTGSGRFLGYRARERFAMCSTFKAPAVAAVLRVARREDPGLLDRLVRYTAADVEQAGGGAVTSKHVETGLTVRELCDAAITYSDNCAANLLMRRIGGPGAVTGFLRTLGDRHSRLDRWEPELNTNLPGDPRDTTTPAAMARSLGLMSLGGALAPPDRAQLNAWLVANTTGDKRIRSVLPGSWRVGDKTGTGERGSMNDIAVAWPPGAAPLVICVYTTRLDAETPGDDRVVAEAADIAVSAVSAVSVGSALV
ncbi:class A beta-lactamase [Streptomyces monticola]|uniref:Beta-lactamase n=1 Tax=Streptomyces monticola TaxID=2666263 RepID=A0ABW2JVX0_9ACTN